MTAAGKNGKLPLAQAGRVQELLQHAAGLERRRRARASSSRSSRNIDEIEAAKKPRALKATLRPYQEAGLSWLKFIHDIGSGGVLADDMGLGKTVQTIALFLAVKQEEKHAPRAHRRARPASSPTGSASSRASRRRSRVALWHGADRKEQIDAVKRRRGGDHQLRAPPPRRGVPLHARPHLRHPRRGAAHQEPDERDRRRGQAPPRQAPPRAHRHARSRTASREIWSIFDFVSPGLLGALDKFEQRFCAAHRGRRLQDRAAPPRDDPPVHPAAHEAGGRQGSAGEDRDRSDLRSHRRSARRSTCRSLREVRAQVLGEVERVGLAKSQLQILAGLTKLRQAACDPRLLGLPRDFTDEDSGKLVALRELISNAIEGGHKVLVFSQFVMMLKIIEKAMKEDGVVYEYLDGSTKDRAGARRSLPERPERPGLPDQPQGGRHRPEPHRRRHGDPLRSVVEPGRRAAGHRPRPPHRPDQGRHRLPARRRRDHRGEDPPAQGARSASSSPRVLSEDAGGAKKLTKTDLEELFALD